MAEKPKTICVKCRWHLDAIWDNGTPKRAPLRRHICECPSVRATPAVDPVTGDFVAPSERHDLRGRPLCRNVNHGNCPHFKAK